jgi:hypothetical protein
MRLSWGKWRGLSRAVAIIASLALLLQLTLPPPGLFTPPPGLDGICHAPTGEQGNRAPPPLTGHACWHCLACQAATVALAAPEQGTLFPAPLPGAATAGAASSDSARGGAPYLAYASRAPPTIG